MKGSEWLARVGLDPAAAHKESIVVKRGESLWVSNRDDVPNAVRPTVRTVGTPEEYKALVVTTPEAAPMMPEGVQGCHVDNVAGAAAGRLQASRTEAVNFVYGKGALSAQAREEIVARYFPLQVSVGAFPDLEINSGAQFVIDGGVGSYHFGNVKIHEGGQFIVYSNASIVIESLQKLPPN